MIRTMDYRSHQSLLIVCIAALGLTAPACGDDGGTTDTNADTGTATSASSTTASTVSDTDPEPTTSVGTMGATSAGTSSMETTTDTTAGATEDSTGTAGETEGSVCAGLEADACEANMDCMTIAGRPILMMGDGACLGPREFIECQPATGCGDAITYACRGDDGPMWEFLDTCIPTTWFECGPPPPIDLMPCP